METAHIIYSSASVMNLYAQKKPIQSWVMLALANFALALKLLLKILIPFCYEHIFMQYDSETTVNWVII